MLNQISKQLRRKNLLTINKDKKLMGHQGSICIECITIPRNAFQKSFFSIRPCKICLVFKLLVLFVKSIVEEFQNLFLEVENKIRLLDNIIKSPQTDGASYPS